MQAVILAGGLGTRLHPFTKVIPKPLLPVGDRSVVEVQIAQLKANGFDTIIFATNYKSDLLESYFGDGSRFGVKLVYSREEMRLGTCGPLSLVRDKVETPFLVMNGDILTNMDFKDAVDFHTKKKAMLTVITKDVVFPLSYGRLVGKGDRITGMQEKPDVRVEIMAGIYVMCKEILQLIPDNQAYGMDQLILKMLDQDIPVYKFKMDAYWLDIGRMEDYEKAQQEYQEHFR